jgi:hypothetical protein
MLRTKSPRRSAIPRNLQKQRMIRTISQLFEKAAPARKRKCGHLGLRSLLSSDVLHLNTSGKYKEEEI